MEETQQAIAPVFKSMVNPGSSHQITPRPAAKLTINNIQVTIFQGAHPNLVSELVKVVVRYAH